MSITKYKYLFLGVSVVLTVLALAAMAGFGYRQGIDFAGGTLWQMKFSGDGTSSESVRNIFSENGAEDAVVRETGNAGEFSVRTKELSEESHTLISGKLAEKLGSFEEMSFASIGPAIGKELRSDAFKAFFLVLAGISLYVSFAFRKVSYPVNSWKYGIVTLITLFHDALIPAGVFAWWGHRYGVEVDTNFIVAILVVMGFSVHDTIVVFDRIRENLINSKNKNDLSGIIDESVRQTFARSVNTSLTLVLVLVALYLFGAHSLGYFTLMILIGTVVGTYSSIFVASPMLTFFHRK